MKQHFISLYSEFYRNIDSSCKLCSFCMLQKGRVRGFVNSVYFLLMKLQKTINLMSSSIFNRENNIYDAVELQVTRDLGKNARPQLRASART